ncbi:WD40 repeat-containing protein, putative, partial [Bodo saltans]
MVSDAAVYILSADALLHQNDAKHIAWGDQDVLYSASRDQTVKSVSVPSVDAAIASDGDGGAMHEQLTFSGHQAFVNFVMVHPSLPLLDGEPAVITGSNDKHVVVWNAFHGGVEAVLDAHSEGVRCGTLLPHTADFITGGWDKVCVVWDGTSAKPKQVFTGHESSVLSLAVLRQGQIVVSSSGDKTVMAWDVNTAKSLHVFKGHTDSVQTVVALSDDTFASSGNDATVFLWSLSLGRATHAFAAHDHLVYSLAFHAPTQLLYSASEDHTVKVWQVTATPPAGDDESAALITTVLPDPVQVIPHPCVVWSVAVRPQSSSDSATLPDIATAGSDGVVRLWSTDDRRMASIDKLEALQVAITNQVVDVKAAASAASGLPDVASMPTVEELSGIQGKEGEKKFCRNGSVVEVHIWGQGSWNKVGVVVSGPDQTPYTGAPQPKEKKFYQEKYYDYLFDVELDGRAMKLSYNRGQNIYDAAQNFIFENPEVSQESKEAIVQHILKLIDAEDAALIGGAAGTKAAQQGDSAAFSDFAKESAALRAQGSQQAQSWIEAKHRLEASGQDVAFSTFAQEGRSLQQGAPTATSSSASAHGAGSVSGATPKTFSGFNSQGARTKIRELLGSDDGDHIVDLCEKALPPSPPPSNWQPSDATDAAFALHAMLPESSRFPATDL